MQKFQAGYAQVNINPTLGIGMHGYYVPRYAKGYLDDLEASALVLVFGETKVTLISVDNCGIRANLADRYRSAIEQATGIPKECVLLSATHTHTGPFLAPTTMFEAADEPILRYADFVEERLVDLVRLALQDCAPARMGFGVGHAPERVAYIRRYRMKDGSTMTCPPINDPNIDHAIGEPDQRVNVLRFDREGKDSVVLVNYGVHADTIGGELLSADWPGWMRRTISKALDGTKCLCFVGIMGDVGSTNVHPAGGDLNDTEISFDNEMKSPGMARFIGRALAGSVLQVYDKVEYIDVDRLKVLRNVVDVPANVPDPEDLPRAHLYKELHDAGRDDEIPYTAMELSTVVSEALRMCSLEHGPQAFRLELTGVQLGDVALVAIPGQPFSSASFQIKETEGWKLILPCCQVNGSEGYFPPGEAFAEGGYEARTSPFRGGVAEILVDGAKEILNRLRAEAE